MLLPSIFNDNVFDDFMDGFDSFMDRSALYGKHGKNLMKTDVRDVGDHYELDMDLPGFKKDEIHAELENGYLTISAEKSLDKDEKDKAGHYIRRERSLILGFLSASISHMAFAPALEIIISEAAIRSGSSSLMYSYCT